MVLTSELEPECTCSGNWWGESLVNQVVRVQGHGEQKHGKDLKFGGRSFVNNI